MSPQSSIAHYRIVSKLGEGGMGAVYRATDTKLNRDIAIKVLPDSFAGDPDRLARFVRESQLLAALNHPNIAAIYGVEDRALVMELVEGQPLQGPLPLETALDYAAQIADALEYAHEKGIIHRDLKPANILVTAEGAVKVLDFGLAKALAADTAAADPATSPTLTMRATQFGMILGTAAYMSPEQAKGKPVDRRADIWAFGVVLWEMLTGQPLFDGETVSDILAQVLTKQPDWNAVPPPARKLLQSCLQRDAKQRLKSIGDWRLLLEENAAAPVAPPRSSRLTWALAAVAVLSLGAAGWAWMRRAEPVAASLYRVNIVPPEGTTLRLDTASPPQAISPDGRSLAFLADTNRATSIWIRPLDGAMARQFAGTELADGLFWSPDSKRLGFSTGADIKILDVSTGAVKTLVDAGSTVRGGTWNSSGTIIYGTTAAGLMSIPADGGKITAVTIYDRTHETNQNWPQFLPDGRHFIYWARDLKPEATGIYAGSLDVAPEKQIRRQILATPNPVFYTAGHLLFARGKTLFAQPFDTAALELKGTPAPVAELGSARDFVSASQNGILTTSPLSFLSKTVTIVSRDGNAIRAIGSPDAYNSIRLSPDGRTVALVRSNIEVGSLDLWLMDLARGVPLPLTITSSVNAFPVWSPDSKEIAYSSTREGGYRMFRRAIVGNGSEQALPSVGQMQFPSQWSKDGKTLLFTEVTAGNQGLRSTTTFLLPLVPGGQPAAVPLRPNSRFPRVSPAGPWIAYTTRETGPPEVYLQELPGESKDLAPTVRISSAGGLNPTWNTDGTELYFNTPDNYLMASAVKSVGRHFEAAEPKRLFALGGSSVFDGGIFWEPLDNGKEFLVLRAAPVTESTNRISVLINWQEALKSRP